MIDFGSRITITTREDVRRLLKNNLIITRPLPKNEEYVHYIGKLLKLLGFINVDVQVEIKILLEEGHIKRVDKITHHVYSTSRHNCKKGLKRVKVALIARSFNNAILKRKYQMPNLENLMVKVGEFIDGNKRTKEVKCFSHHCICNMQTGKRFCILILQVFAIFRF